MVGSTLSSERSIELPPPAPVLIVDQDAPILHYALKDDFPELTFELCASLDQAERHLQTKRYQALITNVRLIAVDNSSLLKLTQSEHPATPLIITLKAYQKALAYEVLKQGASDCILKPVNRPQAVQTMRAALWLHQFRVTIDYRKQTLKTFKAQHTAGALDIPESEERVKLLIDRNIKQVEKTINSCERSIAAIEKSLQYLKGTAAVLEEDARQRAFELLEALPKNC